MVRVDDMPSLAESILEQMADVVIYADETGTIGWWNSAATILFGYSAAEAVGQTPGLIPLHLRDADWRGFHAAMTTGVMKLTGDADMRDAPIRPKTLHRNDVRARQRTRCEYGVGRGRRRDRTH